MSAHVASVHAGKSAIGSLRASLSYLFSRYDYIPSAKVTKNTSKIVLGSRRLVAEEGRRNHIDGDNKDAMPHDVYVLVLRHFWRSEEKAVRH